MRNASLIKTLVMLLCVTTIFLCPDNLYSQQHYHLVGGSLTGENVWENDLPYLVYNNIIIDDSASLTIKPGVVIYFDAFLGIEVNGGRLITEGQSDTIKMMSIAQIDWNGINITNVNNNSSVIIDNVAFDNVENAITINKSSNIVISNCCFENVYLGGILLNNSNYCIIENCFFDNNYRALEVNGDGNLCHDNIIRNNIFTSGQINLMLTSKNHGECFNNTIENNFFGGASTSVYFDNSTQNINRKNIIKGNVISSIAKIQTPTPTSYGIYSAMDSVIIKNNILWKNETAINFKSDNPIIIEKNTFFENITCIKNLPSTGNIFSQNTFVNNNSITTFTEENTSVFENNNFINISAGNYLFINNLEDSIVLSNNYWGTVNDSIISLMLYDQEDDTTYGKIVYKPLLDDYHIDAPVSPPIQVTKQLVDNGVLVRWRSNKESDLDSYRVYHGDFQYYTFSESIIDIHDTVLFLQDVDINNAIAVTSIDTDFNEENGQKKGHESAFSIATMIPYAGSDDTICESEDSFEITEANVPYPVSYMTWTTSGTGTFSDTTIINPIYYPSESDYYLDNITLTITAYMSNTNYSDSFIITMLQNPDVKVGEDMILPYNQTIQLKDVSVNNYQSLEWETLGDGWFDTVNTINPVYHYGINDSITGSVSLVLHAISICENNSDTVNYKLINTYSLEGKVVHSDLPVSNAQIIALTVNNLDFDRFYRTKSDINGNFIFDELFKSQYLLFAIPDTIDYQGTPIYYANKSTWSQSNIINVNGNVYDVDMELSSSSQDLLQGVASIKGSFDFPEQDFKESLYYCEDWFERDTNQVYCSEGLSNIVIYLFNSNKKVLIDYALTDASGNFSFDRLPFGSYYIYSEIPRYQTNTPTVLTLTPDEPEINNLHFYIENGQIYVKDFINNNLPSIISAYPNPCNNEFTISGVFEENTYHIDIHNVTGQLVYHDVNTLQGSSIFSVPTSKLPDGIYFIKIYSSDNILYTNDLIIAH